MLELTLLGGLTIKLDGVIQGHGVDERRGLLLALLSEAGELRSREVVAQMFWPFQDVKQARTNLRSLLRHMRNEGYGPYLQVNRQELGLSPDAPVRCDMLEILQILAEEDDATPERLWRAFHLYTGPFLADIPLDEWPALAEWAEFVQYELEVRMIRLCFRLAHHYMGAGEPAQVLPVTRRLVELAPYDDDAHLLNIRALAAADRPAWALSALKRYQQTMREEFADWLPSADLAALAHQLADPSRAARLAEIVKAPAPAQSAPPVRPEEDAPVIRLVGRRREVEWLEALLDRGARLISVTGLGGIGKTALVRSQLPALRARFSGRLHLVDLRGEESAADEAEPALLQAVAGALGLQPETSIPLMQQVQTALATAPICLILDNFETLLDAGLAVARLVDQTPTLTVITTSRQALYTKDEALVELGGLHVAGGAGRGAASGEAGWSEGAELFLQRAAQQRMGFDRTQVDRAEVETLCAQLGGHPLAIELAAAQLDFYGLGELLTATHTEVDVLATGRGDLPGDHDNLTLLLARMWAPLSPQAQAVLARLSVFAGAFHREAMMAVAPASMQIYRELRNASLLQSMDEPAWFSLHPLVKQAAAARLATDAAGHADARTQHARHYLEFLDLGDEPLDLRVIHEPAVWSRLQRNVADFHLAWRWAVQNADWARLAQAITSFAHLHSTLGQYQRGYALLEELMQRLPPEAEWSAQQTQLAGRAALFLSSLGISGGDLAAAKPWFERALAWLDAAGTAHDRGIVRYHAGARTMYFQEEWSACATHLAQALVIAQQNELPRLIAKIQIENALNLHLPAGHWRAAVDAIREAIPAFESSSGSIVNSIATLVACLQMDEAEKLLIATAPAMAQSEQRFVSGWRALRSLFQCTFLAHRGELDAAITGMESTLRIYTEEEIGQASRAYGFLALCLARRGDFSEAIATARQGLAHSEALGSSVMIGVAKQRLADVLLWAEDFAPVAYKDEVLGLLEQALAAGLEIEDILGIFPALYALVHARRAEIPPALFERMIKIGACSPALYYEMHPIGRARLAAEGIVLTDEEAEALYDTDLVQVKALMEEVEKEMGGW